MNNYYVYIYWRLDINEPFYVGMGHNNRWKELYENKRNEHFIRIINKYPIAVEIIKDNLTEEQAHGIECWLINELVFEYGYSINIFNNRSNEKGCHLVNMTWGGEGTSGRKLSNESIEKIRQANLGKHLSEKTKEKLRIASIGKHKGENNPYYGKHHTEEIRKKMSENHANVSGKNNPMAKSIICLTTKKIFYAIKDAKRFYQIKGENISACCKGKRNYCGKYKGQKLVWRYLVWNHNKKYRIKRTN